MTQFNVRYLQPTEQDVKSCFVFLIGMWTEVGRAPGSPQDADEAFKEVYRVIAEGVALIVEDADGNWIGALGMTDAGWWYAPSSKVWCERWFFVVPPHRNGPAARMMLHEAGELVAATGVPALITVFNRQRFVRRSPLAHEGDKFWITPAGKDLVVEPRNGDEHGRPEPDEYQQEHVDVLPGMDAGRGPEPVRAGGELAVGEPDPA